MLKKMSPYWYIVKIKIQSCFAYRFDVISSLFLQSLVMLSVSFFWISIYGNRSEVVGITQKDMLIYTIIAMLMSTAFDIGVEDKITEGVNDGSVVMDMIKPVHLFGMYIMEDVGKSIASLIQKGIPILIIGSLCICVPVAKSPSCFILFIISLCISYLINWLLAALFGIWIFKAISVGPMRAVKAHIIKLLSGSVIPLWFFPDQIQTVMKCLPFPYIYQLPLGIYIGKFGTQELIGQMSIQLAWLVALAIIFGFVQRKLASFILVQGG